MADKAKKEEKSLSTRFAEIIGDGLYNAGIDLDDEARAIRQMGAGFSDLLLASPRSEGLEYLVPGAVNGLYTLPGTVGQLIGKQNILGNDIDFGEILKLPGHERAQYLLEGNIEQSNRLMGTDNPKNWVDSLNRNVAGLIPIPGAAVARGGTALSTAPQKTNVAGELVRSILPGMTDPTTGRAIAQLAVPTAIESGINELVETPESQYQTLFDDLGVVDPVEQDITMFDPQSLLPEPEEDITTFNPQLLTQQVDSIGEFDPAFLQEEEKSAWKRWAAGSAALLGGFALARGRIKNHNIRNEVIDASPPGYEATPSTPSVDTRPPAILNQTLESATKGTEAAQTVTQDANAILNRQVERATDVERALDFQARVEQLTRGGGATKLNEVYNIGKFSETNKLDFAPNDWNRAYFGLDDQQRKVLNEYLLAKDVQDSRALYAIKKLADGEEIGEIPAASATGWSNKDVVLKIRAIDDFPELKEMAKKYSRMTDATLKNMVEKGVISKETYTDLRTNRPNYVPNIGIDPRTGNLVDKMKRIFNDTMVTDDEAFFSQQLSNMRSRNIEEGSGVQTFLNPAASLDVYMTQLTQYANKKALQREFVETLQNSGIPELSNSLKKVSRFRKTKNDKRPVETRPDPSRQIEIPIGDEIVRYEFADPLVKTALEFAPSQAKGNWETYLNFMRTTKQKGLTGEFAPWFAPVAMVYDATFLAANKPKNFKAGLFNFQGDPTTVFTSMAGIPRDLFARMKLEMSQRMEGALIANQGVFAKYPDLTKRVSERLRDSYLESSLHLAREQGVFNASLLVDAERKIAGMMEGSAASPYSLSLGRTYKAILESVHNSPRLQFFAQNYRPDMTLDELTKLSAETRNIAGDMSKRGLGKTEFILKKPGSVSEQIGAATAKLSNSYVTNVLQSGVPYGNVTIQALTKLGSRATGGRDAKTFAAKSKAMGEYGSGIILGTAIPMVTGAALMSQASDEHRDYYWNKIPKHIRASHIVLPNPFSTPDDPIMIPVAPELALAGSTAVDGADEILGMSRGERIDGTMFSDSIEAWNRLVQVAAPPGITVPTILATSQQLDTVPGKGLEFRDVQTENLSGVGEKKSISSILGAEKSAALQEMFGEVGRLAEETLNAGAYGDDEWFESMSTQLINQTKPKFDRALGGTLPGARPSLNTQASSQLFEKSSAIQNIQEVVDRMLTPRAPLPGREPKPVTNPEFKKYAPMLVEYQEFMKDLRAADGHLRKEVESLRADLPITAERQEAIDMRVRQRQKLMEQQLKFYLSIEESLGLKIEDLDPYLEVTE